jgi:hypothetical protein
MRVLPAQGHEKSAGRVARLAGTAVPAMLVLLTLFAFAGCWPVPVGAIAQTAPQLTASATDAAPSTSATALFSDDFEAFGDSTLWSHEFPFPVQSDLVANGRFAARLFNAGGNPMYGRTTLDGEYRRLFVRIRFQVVQLGPVAATLLNLRAAPTTSVIAIRIDAAGRLSYLTGATQIAETSTISATHGEWHELQVLVDFDAARENVRFWLDSTELTSLRQGVYLGEAAVRMIELGDNSAGQQSDIAYDDIIVDDEFIQPDRQADPVPGRLVVNTFPAWGNIPFELDGVTYYSGRDGVVEIPVSRWSTDLRSRITVQDSYRADGSVATFTGWKNWHSVHSKFVYAAFQISEPVTISFVDPAGLPVDSSLIDSMTIKSSSGVIQTFTGAELEQPVLVTVSSAASGPSGLETRTTRYVVDEVLIGGSNAVHRAQQRSDFDTSRHWTVPLLFYSVTFMARDAFFGSALGTEIVVRSADGGEQRLPLDENGLAVIPRLSRGEYSVIVVGAGYSPPRPIYVSRDQAIEMKVISPVDAASLLMAIGAVVIGLLIAGRPWLVTSPVRALARGVIAAGARGRYEIGRLRPGGWGR